jgi:hypothetical protein
MRMPLSLAPLIEGLVPGGVSTGQVNWKRGEYLAYALA